MPRLLATLVCLAFIQTTFSFNRLCPHDWITYRSSCYKYFKQTGYSTALSKCLTLVEKHQLHKRPYLVNIETREELNFVSLLMMNKNLEEAHVGAHNIFRKTNHLVWEPWGSRDPVSDELLCPHAAKVDNSSYYCGFLRSNSSLRVEFNPLTYCIDTSDCFYHRFYICEVNCTNQEFKCESWSQEHNLALFGKKLDNTKPAAEKQEADIVMFFLVMLIMCCFFVLLALFNKYWK